MLGSLVLLAIVAAPPRPAPLDVQRAVMRVEVHASRYDWNNPWRSEPVESGSGSGFVIEGGLILTNAHVVADGRQILIKRSDRAQPAVARPVAVGHDCDLALLRTEPADFLKDIAPLPLGDLPPLRSQVVTYGYPVGGREVSSTAGIVSRVEMNVYQHSVADVHLSVQTDAAINPGNSGGPVVQDGKVVGVAFQGYSRRDNIAFFIPTPVVRHFLQDARDGKYDGFPDAAIRWLPLTSPAFRRERGLPDSKSGVVIQDFAVGGTADGVLQPGDVLTSVEGVAIENDGRVTVGPHRVSFLHLFDLKQLGEPVRLSVVRGGREVALTATSKKLARRTRMARSYDEQPKFLIHAGLLFMPLGTPLLEMLGGAHRAPRELAYYQYFHEWENRSEADREVVVLTRVFKHPVNSQLAFTGPQVVERVNGHRIEGLRDLERALSRNEGDFQVFELGPDNGLEALDRKRAAEAHPEILERYGISQDKHL